MLRYRLSFSVGQFLWRFELLGKPFARTVVVNADQKERKVFGSGGANVTDGVGEARTAIGEEGRQSVVRNNENSDIDHASG
jgi:hypothetical protein